MSEIAMECNKPQHRHHPEWSNVYNFTRVRWTTHWPEGISGKDLEMARFCDEVAGRWGEVEEEGEEDGEGEGKGGKKGGEGEEGEGEKGRCEGEVEMGWDKVGLLRGGSE